MNDGPAPETDAAWQADKDTVFRVETSRRIERERDGAREALKHIGEYGTEEINAAVELRQKLAQALVDLDNMQDQRDFAMKVIKRLEQERDEVREDLKFRRGLYKVQEEYLEAARKELTEAKNKLDEEIKWHHQTHKELVETQCKLLDIEYDKLKS